MSTNNTEFLTMITELPHTTLSTLTKIQILNGLLLDKNVNHPYNISLYVGDLKYVSNLVSNQNWNKLKSIFEDAYEKCTRFQKDMSLNMKTNPEDWNLTTEEYFLFNSIVNHAEDLKAVYNWIQNREQQVERINEETEQEYSLD